jgi:cysteine desulfurase/selenocysteine lyase
MYTLFTDFRDGDNVVTTLMEHNSNYVPWYAMCREILPKFGRHVEYRLVRFDPLTGELDLDHLRSLIDDRTKLVCCTGASNFFGTKNPLPEIRAMASASGYVQPDGECRSYLLVDGAQLVPSTPVDVQALDVDYLSFSFHKILAPFGVGVLYGREHLLESSRPFLYGGDMIAQGQVFPDRVAYNALPWKFGAGTPNILGTVISAQALRLVVDLARSPRAREYFGSDRALPHDEVTDAMTAVMLWTRRLVAHAMARLVAIPGLTMYGPREAAHRTSLVSFNVAGWDPMALAARLNDAGVESRAGCHCATLAHHQLALDPPASCRLSFYLYNTLDEVDRAADALTEIVSVRTESVPRVDTRRRE